MSQQGSRLRKGFCDGPGLADMKALREVDAAAAQAIGHIQVGKSAAAMLLVESRNYFGGLLEIQRLPVQDTAGAAGLTALPPFVGRRSA